MAKTRPEITVVADQVGTPTYTCDLAASLADLIETPLYGTYHISNSGQCSWFDYARTILRFADLTNVRVKPIRSEEWPSPTRRPKYSVLRPYMRELQGKPPLRSWESALQDYFEELKASS